MCKCDVDITALDTDGRDALDVSSGQRNWCKRELGEHVPVITCMSRDKHIYCRPGNILIDDRCEAVLGIACQQSVRGSTCCKS